MIKKEQIFYELVGEQGFLNQALKKQEEGKVVDINSSVRLGAACYVLVWHESEEVQDVPEVVVEKTPEKTGPVVDYKYLDSLKEMNSKEAKALLIEYAVSIGLPAEKFDKRKSLDKLRKTFAGIISQMK